MMKVYKVAAATYSVTVKMLQDVLRSTSGTIMRKPGTPAAPTATSATLQPTCVP
jgi:hypothetical protein